MCPPLTAVHLCCCFLLQHVYEGLRTCMPSRLDGNFLCASMLLWLDGWKWKMLPQAEMPCRVSMVKDRSPVHFLPFTMKRNERTRDVEIRTNHNGATVHISIISSLHSLLPVLHSSEPSLSLGISFIFRQHRPVSSSRQADTSVSASHQGINTVVCPYVVTQGLTHC